MEALELKRRDFLAASFGLLAAGCADRTDLAHRAAHISGEIRGPNDQRGHLLRDGGEALRSRTPAVSRRTDVLILGGGVAGLSAAWRLSRAGLSDYVLLEGEDQVGGTARSGECSVSPYPWGAHYLPVPSRGLPALCELLRELDVITGFDAAGRALCGEAHLCRAPQERIFYKGRWYEGLYLRAGASAEDLRQFSRFHDEIGRWVREVGADGRRVFTLPHDRTARGHAGSAELDGLTLRAHLDRLGLHSSRLRWYVDYACRDDFGLRSDATSAWAGLHYYASRLVHPDDAPPEVLTWPEGNGWLVRKLTDRVGARIETGCLVLDVRQLPAGGDDRVEVIYLDTRRGSIVGSIRARHVVFALPTFLRPYLISDLRPSASRPEWLRHFTYAPWLVANLTVRRGHALPVASALGGTNHPNGAPQPAIGFPSCWDNVLVESPSLGYVVATHQREAAPAKDGIPRTVWTYYLPLCDGDPRRERSRLLQTPWSTWRDFVLTDLERAEPGLAGQVERIDLFRWGHGMVRPVAGLMTSGALEAATAPLGDIHFAHTDLSGIALFEEANHAGVRAAEAILTNAGHPHEKWS
jgi:hypothetical protein